MRYALLSLLLCGCTFSTTDTPIIIENNEKEAYIKKVEQTIGESTSALVAVAPSVPAGIGRELLQNQIDRLSAISKPSAGSVELFRRILSTNDEKGLQAQDKKADKSDSELQRLKEKSDAKEKELDAEKVVRAATEAKLERVNKDKVLWMVSCVGMAIAVVGLVVSIWTPFKGKGILLMAGGSISVSASWILDSKWFTVIIALAVSIIVSDLVIMAVAWLHDKWKNRLVG